MKHQKPFDPTLAVLVRRHYKLLGIISGWNREKFNRLCNLSNLLPEELGALCALSPGETFRMIRNDKFPPPVSLHLENIQNIMEEFKFKASPKVVMPLHLFGNKVGGVS